MEQGDKVDLFKAELGLIPDASIRSWAEWAVSVLPDYFFSIAASSTGKYHPGYALGDGGLVRHVKAAVHIADTLLGVEMFADKYDNRARSCIIAALILHDGCKKGVPEQKYTVTEHPLVVCSYLEKELESREGGVLFEEFEDRECVYSLIRSHMGQWNTDRDGHGVLPKPETAAQKFVHMCDYLASRKMLEFNFDAV